MNPMFWLYSKKKSGEGASFVNIAGDNSVGVSTNAVLTATTDGTGTPVWEPEPSSGQGTLSATYNYAVLGRRNVTCTVGGVTSSIHILDVGFPTYFWDLADTNATVGGINLTNNNGVAFGSGKVGNAAEFIASSDQSLSANLPAVPRPFTVALWFLMTEDTDNYGMIFSSDTSITEIYRNRTFNQVRLGGNTDAVNTHSFTYDDWHILALVATDTGFTCYLDNQTPTTGSILFSLSSNLMTLGRRSSGGLFFDGGIDECMIFDRSLSQDEVTHLYNSGSGIAYPWAH